VVSVSLCDVELSSGELGWLAGLSLEPVHVAYGMDVHVTLENDRGYHVVNVTPDTLVSCTECGTEHSATDWLFGNAECCDAPEPAWRTHDDQAMPHELSRALQCTSAHTEDWSEPDVDEWCGEFVTTTHTWWGWVEGVDGLEWLERFYDYWGGVWDGLSTCDTMGTLGVDGWLPAVAIESIDEWSGDPNDHVFAGSLYITDPRLMVRII